MNCNEGMMMMNILVIIIITIIVIIIVIISKLLGRSFYILGDVKPLSERKTLSGK